MKCKWDFRNEVSETFSKIPAFRPKSNWLPPKGHASLETFLSQLDKELFTNDLDEPSQSNLSAEEWKALRNLAVLSLRVQMKAHPWLFGIGQTTYWKLKKHLNDKRVYKEVTFNENILAILVEKSNKIFIRLCSLRLISES